MGKISPLCLAPLLLVACSTPRPKGRTAAEVLFREAEASVKNKRYIIANDNLNLLRSRYPYSFYATRAELMQADIYFLQENYIEAASAYILFRDFHPKHKEMPRIIFRIGDSFFKQLPSTYDRDLSSGIEAIHYFNEVVQKYPKTKYATRAKKKITLIQEMMDMKEKYIADFYFKTEKYFAARYRYIEILKIVKDAAIRTHAMGRIIESSYLLKEYDKCVQYIGEYFAKLNEKDRMQFQEIEKSCRSNKKT